VVACLAAISAGAVVVPLDAQLGGEALGRVLVDSGARQVLTTADQEGRLANVDTEAGLRAILLDVGEDDGRSWRCLLMDEDVDLPPVEPDDVASLFAAPLVDKGAHCGSLAFAQRRHTVVHGLDDLLLRPGAPVIVVGGQRFAEGHRDLLQPS